MNATTKYIKRLLDQNRRLQDLDVDAYKGEPHDVPDWAKGDSRA